ncbi:AsmA family protein, partial [Undibacterium sp. CCC2.1]|nr:AsmA family protein [Undibacterium sp. CCC2.1]
LRTADGKNNWTLPSGAQASAWQLELKRVVFSKGRVHLMDAIKHADMTADIDTINTDPAYGVTWKLHGKFNGDTVSGSGKAGAILSLQQ